MSKQNRKPGIHLHKTQRRTASIKNGKINKDIFQTEYFWILIARNGKTIARSSETYKRKGSAVRSISIAAKVFANAIGMFGGFYIDHTGKEIKTDYYDHF